MFLYELLARIGENVGGCIDRRPASLRIFGSPAAAPAKVRQRLAQQIADMDRCIVAAAENHVHFVASG